MKREHELEKGLYFVHGYYMSDYREQDINELYRDQMILLKENIDSIYDIEAYDVNLREVRIQDQISPGEFVFYNGEEFQTAENDPTSIVYTELNQQLTRLISYENYGNQPIDISNNISRVFSYHVNVGHGNCSIIVFCEDGNYTMWMIDCSVFDFTNRQNYSNNLDRCMDDIYKEFRIKTISKLLITHLHYDHINGVEHLIKNKWIDRNTEVWMNTQYPWKQPTYNRILLQLKAMGVRIIDPVVGNSTQHINILYPYVSYNSKNKAPKNNINNASVLYQIRLGQDKMLFTGDIEAEGWDKVKTCYPHLNESTYYCISHHGSITGHLRSICVEHMPINTLANCAHSTQLQVLMGRDNAYKGIFSPKVTSDFQTILKTEAAKHYFRIEWGSKNPANTVLFY